MTEQLDMFAILRPPPILRPVEPHGPVVESDPDEVLRLPHPRLAWDLAAIELHRHSDGLWMWSVNHGCGGYRVGPKWGKFASTRDDALHHAAQELIARTRGTLRRANNGSQIVTPAQLRQTIAWAEALL